MILGYEVVWKVVRELAYLSCRRRGSLASARCPAVSSVRESVLLAGFNRGAALAGLGGWNDAGLQVSPVAVPAAPGARALSLTLFLTLFVRSPHPSRYEEENRAETGDNNSRRRAETRQ